MTITIRAANRDDTAGVREVIRAAFAGEGEIIERLVAALNQAGHVQASLVAIDPGDDGDGAKDCDPDRRAHAANAADDSTSSEANVLGRVIGHVQLNRSWVDARERLVEVCVLSPLSVHPDYQGRGVGRALVARALDEAGRRGSPAVFLEGDPAFYRQAGFGPASAHGFIRPSTRIPDPACQVALLPGHQPWMTGQLVYCDPFWALDTVGLREPELSRVETSLASGQG